jgi:hypothetical protein
MPSFDQVSVAVTTGLLRADDQQQFDPNMVTPGFVGFIATFGVAAVVILLVIDMVRRIRRVNYRAQVREQLDKETRDAESAAIEDSPTS